MNVRNALCGNVAVRLGFTTTDKIEACLHLQESMRMLGLTPGRLGEILLREGCLTEIQIHEVLSFQAYRNALASIPGYKIISRIGRGAIGAVYRALQCSMDRIVAIKCLIRKYAGDEDFRGRFLREARVAARLNHENIVQGIDAGVSKGIPYFVMEYVDGPTVSELLEITGIFVEKEALSVTLQLALALEHTHARGIVHGDVKPANVILTREGIAKLCDLGLARPCHEASALPESEKVMGTPDYVSPEVARGQGRADIRSDLYSLGATVYHMVTGIVPIVDENSSDVILRHSEGGPKSPKSLRPSLSDGVNTIILKLMERDPEKRYQSPSQLIQDLRALQEDGVVHGSVPGSKDGDIPVRATAARKQRRFGRLRRKPAGLWTE